MHPGPPATQCLWCNKPIIQANLGRRRRTCSKLCRQALWRFHVTPTATDTTLQPRHFAYADPPYPGHANLYPERQEVDHKRLLRTLTTNYPDGWALSTSERSLRDILPLCPPATRICAWVKKPRPHKHARALSSWEPLLVFSGPSDRTPPTTQPHTALVARGIFRALPGALIGMKPPAFAQWLFLLLNARPGDTLDDLFPGSGAITRAWHLFTGKHSAEK